MASTDPPNLTTSDRSKLTAYQLKHQNSSSSAFYTPKTLTASLPDDDERSIVDEDEAARSVAAINSRHKAASLRADTRARHLERRSLGNQGRASTAPSFPVVEDDDDPIPNPWDESLNDLDISPIFFPDPEPQPALDSQNHQAPAFPEPFQQSNLPIPSPTAESYSSEEEYHNYHASDERPRSNSGGIFPLPSPLVHPHQFPDLTNTSSFIVYPSRLNEPERPATTPSPPLSFPSPDDVSNTTSYENIPENPQPIRPPSIRPGSVRPDQDQGPEVRPTQATTFGSATISSQITTPPSHQQQRPPSTRPIASQPSDYQEEQGQDTPPPDPQPPKAQRPPRTQISRPSSTQPPKAQSARLPDIAPPKALQPKRPQNTPPPNIQQSAGTRPPQIQSPLKPQPQTLPLPESQPPKVTTPPLSVKIETPEKTSAPPAKVENTQVQPEQSSMDPKKSQMETQYVNMLLALDDIPQIYNTMANFFTWILLAGFILFPGTFTSLKNLGNQGTVDPRVVDAVTHVPLFVIAWVCTAIGGTGMIWLTWRWHKNYIWVLNRVFLPGCLNSLAGLLSTVTNIFGVQHGQLGTTSKVTLVVTCVATGVCGILTLIYTFWLVRRVKAKHDREVGKQRAGKHGEGVLDLSKRKMV